MLLSPLECFTLRPNLLVAAATVTALQLLAVVGLTSATIAFSLVVPPRVVALLGELTWRLLVLATRLGSTAAAPLLAASLLTLALANLVGLLPFVPAITANFGASLSLSAAFTLAGLASSLAYSQEASLDSLLPPGCPSFIRPLISAIEAIGAIARSGALAIRLAANLTAGHTLLSLLAAAHWSCLSIGSSLTGVIAVGLTLAAGAILQIAEAAVALVQAYVYAIILASIIGHGHGVDR